MALQVRVSQIIDQARIQDARFFDLRVPDGALVLCVNQTQRLLLLQYSHSIQGLIDQSVQVAAQVSGALVGVDANGNPYYLTTSGQGYPVSNAGTAMNVIPYFDTTLAPVSLDPFGVNGGTPGFPLPADLIKLIQVIGTYQDGTMSEIAIIQERSRMMTGTHDPTVFINGNRLVPIRAGLTAPYNTFNDWWTSLTGITTSYIAMQSVSLMTDVITLPVVLHDALIAAVADLLARATPAMSAAERQGYLARKEMLFGAVSNAGIEMLQEVMQESVLFRGS